MCVHVCVCACVYMCVHVCVCVCAELDQRAVGIRVAICPVDFPPPPPSLFSSFSFFVRITKCYPPIVATAIDGEEKGRWTWRE